MPRKSLPNHKVKKKNNSNDHDNSVITATTIMAWKEETIHSLVSFPCTDLVTERSYV